MSQTPHHAGMFHSNPVKIVPVEVGMGIGAAARTSNRENVGAVYDRPNQL